MLLFQTEIVKNVSFNERKTSAKEQNELASIGKFVFNATYRTMRLLYKKGHFLLRKKIVA